MTLQRRVSGIIAGTALIGLFSIMGACTPSVDQGVRRTPTPAVWDGGVGPAATETGHAPIPTPILESGKGGVVGKVVLEGARWEDARVFLAPFYHVGDDGKGFYLLEPSVHPQAPLRAGGFFQIADVAPGYYVMVIVVGLDPLAGVVVKAGSEPRIIQVLADEVLDVGQVPYIQP
jgi:hypothetical protein